MAVATTAAIHHVLQTMSSGGPDAVADRELLHQFIARRDQSAFAELVRRHGPMVMGACRRSLGNRDEAEDAFQATFLALARRASSVRWQPSIAGWLHTVACRAAARLRRELSRARTIPPQAVRSRQGDPAQIVCLRDAMAALDEELSRLPAHLREPVVLCCLQGLARDEAAQALGLSLGALKRRLERGRAALASRLRRRGLELPAVFAASLWADPVNAVSVRVMESAANLPFATTISPGISALASHLTRNVLPWPTMIVASVMIVGLGVLSLAVATTGSSPPSSGAPALANALPPVPLLDRRGDPLPVGAVARLGTSRQRAPSAAIAVSADGKQIVTVGPTLVVRRFNATTGALDDSRTLPAPPTGRLELSATGRRLATVRRVENRSEIVVWGLDNAKVLHTLRLPGDREVKAIAVSPNEELVGLVVSPPDESEEVLLWDLLTGKTRTIHQRAGMREQDPEPAVRFAPDGKSIAAWLRDGQLRCWGLATDALLWEAEHRQSSIFCFSPDSRWVVTGSCTRLDATSGKPAPWANDLPDKNRCKLPLGFSPDGRTLAIRTPETEVLFWGPETGKVTQQIAHPAVRPRSSDMDIDELPRDFAFTPDSTGFVWRAGPIQRWDVRTGKPVFADTWAEGHTEAVARVVFSADGRQLASLAADGECRARVWDVATARALHEFPTSLSSHLAFNAKGHLFALSEHNGPTALDEWDTRTGRKTQTYSLTNTKEFYRTSNIGEILIHPNGSAVSVLTYANGAGHEECILTTWDTQTGATLRHKRVGWGPNSMFTPDGTGVVAIHSESQKAQLLAVDTGKPRVEFSFTSPRRRAGDRYVVSEVIAISPDGRFVAVAVNRVIIGTDQTEPVDMFIGDARTGQQLAHFPRKGDARYAFSPDSRLFVAADGTGLRLWETATWSPAGTISLPAAEATGEARRPWATSLAISPDGRLIATGHPDGTILLWDASLGPDLGPLGADEANRLWDGLAAESAATAYAATWRLARAPEVAVPLVRERFKPVTPRAAGPLGAKETLRAVRAVWVLERIGSPESRRVLESLAGGAADARLTGEAKAALTRLATR